MDKGFNVFLFSAITGTEKYLSQEEAYQLKLTISDDIVSAFEGIFISPDAPDAPTCINWLMEDTLFDPISGESYICCAVSTSEDMAKAKQSIKDTIAAIVRKYLSINSHSCMYLGQADDINQCIGIMDSTIGELLNCKGVKK